MLKGLERGFWIACFFVLCGQVFGQGYNTAMGVRLGQDMGFTIQQRIAKKITIEGIAQYNRRYEESTMTLMVESHMPILFRRFNIYTGIGPHYMWSQNRETTVAPSTGVTLVAGFEMAIGRMNLSWDYKPMINVTGSQAGFLGQSAISARYVLFKRKKGGKINLKFWEGSTKKQRQKTKRKRQRARVKNRKV